MSQNFTEVDSGAALALALAIAVVALLVVGTGLTSFLIDNNVRAISRRQLHHVAAHDALTGLPNRTSFQRQLAGNLDGYLNPGKKLAVIGIDLNRFKEINDTFGHAAGDEVLRILARRMEQILRDDEFIARLGGDEFAAIKPFSDRDEILSFAKRIESVFSRPIEIGAMDGIVGASSGSRSGLTMPRRRTNWSTMQTSPCITPSMGFSKRSVFTMPTSVQRFETGGNWQKI